MKGRLRPIGYDCGHEVLVSTCGVIDFECPQCGVGQP